MSEIIPRTPGTQDLVKTGTKGVASLIAGVSLLFLRNFGGVFGLIVGGALLVFGVTVGTKADTTDDRVGGFLSVAAGALTVLASLPIIGGAASALMGLGGFSLAAYGGVELFRFFRGARRRRGA